MSSVLHGTWIVDSAGRPDGLFFFWAERPARANSTNGPGPRIRRHPYAATSIEVARILAGHYPSADWLEGERLTRVAILPSTAQAPAVPRWFGAETEPGEETLRLRPWRVEGLGAPIERAFAFLAALPRAEGDIEARERLGDDLRFWGLVSKLAVELLARERFLPGMRSTEESIQAAWLPLLDGEADRQRLAVLAAAMPAVCRALLREGATRLTTAGRAGSSGGDQITADDLPRADRVLESMIEHVVDSAVRAWAPAVSDGAPLGTGSGAAYNAQQVARAWWQALRSPQGELTLPPAMNKDAVRFYQAWQSWTHRAQPLEGTSFRLCFRLDPPATESAGQDWTLRYFLQAVDDPSLLVPAQEVWQERGEVLSYLARRFDHPQESLLAGLGMAARLCPAIQRSLKTEGPDRAILTTPEVVAFLRDTARPLEGMGFTVLVPPWWNRSDARLSVRLRLGAAPEAASSGLLNMDSLVTYDWELALGEERLSREEFERLAGLKTSLVQLRGRWVMLQPEQVEAAIAFWQKQQERSDMPVQQALSLALASADQLDGLAVGEVQAEGWFAGLLELLNGDGTLQDLLAPEGFAGKLRPYQVRGFSWLAFMRRYGCGACLAGDMGLGKTIQATALLLHVNEEERAAPAEEASDGGDDAGREGMRLDRDLAHGIAPSSPSLIICPTSVVGNWRREVERFAPSMRVMVHHGSGRAGGSDLVEQSLRHHLVISTYGLARRDIDHLLRVPWSNVIIDEAQNIKNPFTKQARAIRRLGGRCRIALTGTPIENHLSELWSIMAFLNPGYLGALESFRRTFILPIERYQDQESAAQLRRLVRPFVLRRLKTDPRVIQDLPEKLEYKVYCHLTREQATLYEAIVREAVAGIRGLEGGGRPMQRRGLVLAMLTRLKQVCDHPALFLGDGSALGTRSGKLNRLREMLEEVLGVGDRALIFTQYAEMGHLLQRHLQESFSQEVLFLHGGTPERQREQMVRRFQEEERAPHVFVLSLKAGGTGLNLMRANHVFHYDRWWNPAVENQATDRAYRIGQTSDVQVQKMVCLGTLEERIDALIESKRALAESVVGLTDDWLTELGADDLRELVALRAEALEVE